MAEKICPLFKKHCNTGRVNNLNCAWWAKEFDECAITSIFTLLYSMTDSGERRNRDTVTALRVFSEEINFTED